MEETRTIIKICKSIRGWCIIRLTDGDSGEPVRDVRRASKDIEAAFKECHPLTSLSTLEIYTTPDDGYYRINKRLVPPK